MKPQLIAAVLLFASFAVATETIDVMYCSASNISSACYGLDTNVLGTICCAAIVSKNGSSVISQANLCYSRVLAYLLPSVTVGQISTTYTCLDTAPTNWTSDYISPSCSTENDC